MSTIVCDEATDRCGCQAIIRLATRSPFGAGALMDHARESAAFTGCAHPGSFSAKSPTATGPPHLDDPARISRRTHLRATAPGRMRKISVRIAIALLPSQRVHCRVTCSRGGRVASSRQLSRSATICKNSFSSSRCSPWRPVQKRARMPPIQRLRPRWLQRRRQPQPRHQPQSPLQPQLQLPLRPRHCHLAVPRRPL